MLRHGFAFAQWGEGLSKYTDQRATTVGDYLSDSEDSFLKHSFLFDQSPELNSTVLAGFAAPIALLEPLTATAVLSIGRAHTGIPFHSHQASWLQLLNGSKHWFLLPPAENFAVSGGSASAFLLQSPPAWPSSALADYRASGKKLLECTQAPGEVLWLPAYWWHSTVALQSTVAVGGQAGMQAEVQELKQQLLAIVDGEAAASLDATSTARHNMSASLATLPVVPNQMVKLAMMLFGYANSKGGAARKKGKTKRKTAAVAAGQAGGSNGLDHQARVSGLELLRKASTAAPLQFQLACARIGALWQMNRCQQAVGVLETLLRDLLQLSTGGGAAIISSQDAAVVARIALRPLGVSSDEAAAAAAGELLRGIEAGHQRGGGGRKPRRPPPPRPPHPRATQKAPEMSPTLTGTQTSNRHARRPPPSLLSPPEPHVRFVGVYNMPCR
jgi:hypothetical protein